MTRLLVLLLALFVQVGPAQVGPVPTSHSKTDAKLARASYEEGLRWQGTGAASRALEAFTTALELGADPASTRRRRGQVLCTLGRFQKAIEDLDEAVLLA